MAASFLILAAGCLEGPNKDWRTCAAKSVDGCETGSTLVLAKLRAGDAYKYDLFRDHENVGSLKLIVLAPQPAPAASLIGQEVPRILYEWKPARDQASLGAIWIDVNGRLPLVITNVTENLWEQSTYSAGSVYLVPDYDWFEALASTYLWPLALLPLVGQQIQASGNTVPIFEESLLARRTDTWLVQLTVPRSARDGPEDLAGSAPTLNFSVRYQPGMALPSEVGAEFLGRAVGATNLASNFARGTGAVVEGSPLASQWANPLEGYEVTPPIGMVPSEKDSAFPFPLREAHDVLALHPSFAAFARNNPKARLVEGIFRDLTNPGDAAAAATVPGYYWDLVYGTGAPNETRQTALHAVLTKSVRAGAPAVLQIRQETRTLPKYHVDELHLRWAAIDAYYGALRTVGGTYKAMRWTLCDDRLLLGSTGEAQIIYYADPQLETRVVAISGETGRPLWSRAS